jgi:hypothetical protein
MTPTQSRTAQYIGLVLLLGLLAAGYWYFEVRASLKLGGDTQSDLVTSGLVGYWSFNGGDMSGTTATDRGSGGNNGTLTNGPVRVTGITGQAIDFDGADDYVTVTDNAALDFNDTADFSLSVWFNRETSDTTDTIIAKRNGTATTDQGYILYIDASTDKVVFEVCDAVSACDEYQLASTSTFTSIGWNHVAVVWDQDAAGTTKLYVNGVDDSAAATGTIGNIGDLSTTLAFRIGAESDGGEPFNGKIDEARLYNRTLAATEISNLSRLGAAKLAVQQGDLVSSGLVSYWSFNGADISGTTATDRGSGANNGTLTNGPTRVQGKVGQALNFDGADDYVITAANQDYELLTKSFSAWIFPQTITGTDVVFALPAASVTNLFLDVCSSDATECPSTANTLSLYTRRTNGDNGVWYASGANRLTLNAWNHIVVTLDCSSTANDPVMYINGVSVPVTETDAPSGGNCTEAVNKQAYIGSDTSADFDGFIDELRIYNRILSANEVAALYALGGGSKASSTASVPQGAGDPIGGLAGYWPLDEGTGTSTSDKSQFASTGTLTNGPTWTTGQIGSAVDFDGADDYIDVGDINYLEGADGAPFSIAGWFNRDTFTTDDTIVAKETGPNLNSGYIVYVKSTDELVFSVDSGTGDYTLTSTQTFTTTGWNHFVGVWDERGARLYINGNLATTTAVGTASNVQDYSSANSFRIGAESDAGNPFDGKIDEIRLYSYPLREADVKRLYQTTAASAPDTALRLYFQFEEAQTAPTSGGQTFLADLSGNLHNTGVILNTPQRYPGKVGQGFRFGNNTNKYINVGSDAAIDSMNPLSVCAWIFPLSYGTSTDDSTIASKYSGSAAWYFQLGDDNGGTQTLYFSANFTTNDGAWRAPANAITLNTWNHVCVTYNSSSTANDPILYVNGTSQTITEFSTPSGSYDSATDNGSFDGTLDELRVYERTLTATEIQNLYNQGK